MEKLILQGTKSTPEVHFNPEDHVFVIKGQSFPENAFKFYEPLLNWIDEYLQQMHDEFTLFVELQLPYINTSSTKCLMMLLDKLNSAYLSGKKVQINWLYNEDNEIELECAEEFKEDLDIPFHITPQGQK